MESELPAMEFMSLSRLSMRMVSVTRLSVAADERSPVE
jgi:hypothetical protein